MFAVIKTGGKQYKVAAADIITVEKVAGAPGDIVEFGEVLMLGGDSMILGEPTVTGATVAGERRLPAEQLHAEAPASRVATIARRTARLLVSHDLNSSTS